MTHGNGASAKEIRQGLDHPVIDSDGHWIEYGPHLVRGLKQLGGDAAVNGFLSFGRGVAENVAKGLSGRLAARVGQDAWWALPTQNTLDRATAMMPNLMRSRLDEFGIDFAVIYPTSGLGLPQVDDERERRAACNAYNAYAADYFSDHVDRMTPAAVIPMHTPEEAVEELEHVRELGLKAVMFGSMMRRPLDTLSERAPEIAHEHPWLDVIGLDSPHDYDPVWKRCVELGFSPTFHSSGRGPGFGLRNVPSNFVYNHIGHFAAASEAVCKALLLGGVPHRFPSLKFGFLEGGAGWACQLLCDVIGHWEKRRVGALDHVNPNNFDDEGFMALASEYARDDIRELFGERAARSTILHRTPPPAEGLDDFSACGFESEDDIVRQFVDGFYFGCEADDSMNAWAFKRDYLPKGVQLKTLFGSDIGHFDVQNMADVLPEAYEMVDDGLINAADFRAFVFDNPVQFLGENNPTFFDGTVIETDVKAALSQSA